ncbi:MAG: phosphatidylglycerophosphatase A [Bacteroidetes bacterium]|nr:phosphatidylglycerophosphatase A [Bacteroidota bacterium]
MRISKIIASGLGTGYAPFAPGTAGSLLGIAIIYALNSWVNELGMQQPTILILNLGAIVSVLFIGVYAIKVVRRFWEHDDPKIVIDEITGVWIAALALPMHWTYYFFAFVLFRFFDILKPLGIKMLDKQKNDWSVMLDDVLAGIYALIILQIAIYFHIL